MHTHSPVQGTSQLGSVSMFLCFFLLYLRAPGRPIDIGLQLGKACYPCSRLG